jgi:hypothetical protein
MMTMQWEWPITDFGQVMVGVNKVDMPMKLLDLCVVDRGNYPVLSGTAQIGKYEEWETRTVIVCERGMLDTDPESVKKLGKFESDGVVYEVWIVWLE